MTSPPPQPAPPRLVVVQLPDGTPIGLRAVIPEDREAIRTGFREMSQTSRHMRFFVAGQEMSETQARYFTEIDQVNHVAVCAIEPVEAKRGYGIARFVRDPVRTESAEFAIAVIDEMQRRGIGTVLLAALYLKARARGVKVLYGEFMASNPVMPHWLPKLGAEILPGEDSTYRVARWPIDREIKGKSPAPERFLQWLGRLQNLKV